MEFVLGAVIVLLVLFVCYQEHRHVVERVALLDRHYAEREALLNRLMSRNLAEYVQADMASRYQPQEQPPRQRVEEDYDIGL